MRKFLPTAALALLSFGAFSQATEKFRDDFNDNTVAFASADGAWTSSETAGAWVLTTNGHGEWEGFSYTFNDGTDAASFDLSGNSESMLWMSVKADTACVFRADLQDNSTNGKDGGPRATDNTPGTSTELSTTYQDITINFAGAWDDIYDVGTAGTGKVDSTDIRVVTFLVNGGFASQWPSQGSTSGNTYDFPFANGTSGARSIYIDYIAIGSDIVAGLDEASALEATKISPNPSNGITRVNFSLSSAADVEVSVSNLLGETVATQDAGSLEAGAHHVNFDVSGLTSGMYIVSYTVDGSVAGTSKLVVE